MLDGARLVHVRRHLPVAAVVLLYSVLAMLAVGRALDDGDVVAGDAASTLEADALAASPGTSIDPSIAVAGHADESSTQEQTASTARPVDGPSAAVASRPAESGPASAGQSGPGFDAGEIKIGIELLDENSSAAAGSIGAKTTDTGPTRRYAEAFIGYVNDHGGVAGRKVTPVFHTTDLLVGTWDGQAQSTCAAFAEDNTVFAVVSAFYQLSDVLPQCLSDKGIPLTLNGRAVRDREQLGELADFVYMPSRMSADRWAALTVDGLAAQGFFAEGRLGLIRFDTAPLNRAVDGTMKPRLAQLGVEVVADEAVSAANGLQEFGATGGEIGNAILRLRQAGVDHVIPVDDHGILMYLLTPQADSQGYRPRYGLSTNNQPYVLEENAPDAQMVGAVGVGWAPSDDMSFVNDEFTSPRAALCGEILHSAGVRAFPSRYAWSNALNYCDSLLFYAAALDHAPSLTPAGLREGVAALGTSYQSAVTFATAFDRDRHDGAAGARYFSYREDCLCFRYTSDVIEAP